MGRSRLGKAAAAVFATRTGQTRFVPIVPELFEQLSEAWNRAPDTATKILTMSRNNRHWNFTIIIERVGLAGQVANAPTICRNDVCDAVPATRRDWLDQPQLRRLAEALRSDAGLRVRSCIRTAGAARSSNASHRRKSFAIGRNGRALELITITQNKSQQPVEVTGFT